MARAMKAAHSSATPVVATQRDELTEPAERENLLGLAGDRGCEVACCCWTVAQRRSQRLRTTNVSSR